MKTVLSIAAIALITVLLLDNFPWWSCGIIAFVISLALRQKPGAAFLSGFAGVALAWGVAAGWIDVQNTSLLSTRIGNLFGGIAPVFVVILTALIGGLVGGCGGMTGGALSKVIFKPRV